MHNTIQEYADYLGREIAAGYLKAEMSGKVLVVAVGKYADMCRSVTHTYQPKGIKVGDTVAMSRQQALAYAVRPIVYKVY